MSFRNKWRENTAIKLQSGNHLQKRKSQKARIHNQILFFSSSSSSSLDSIHDWYFPLIFVTPFSVSVLLVSFFFFSLLILFLSLSLPSEFHQVIYLLAAYLISQPEMDRVRDRWGKRGEAIQIIYSASIQVPDWVENHFYLKFRWKNMPQTEKRRPIETLI